LTTTCYRRLRAQINPFCASTSVRYRAYYEARHPGQLPQRGPLSSTSQLQRLSVTISFGRAFCLIPVILSGRRGRVGWTWGLDLPPGCHTNVSQCLDKDARTRLN
jgi:hypothetical protein